MVITMRIKVTKDKETLVRVTDGLAQNMREFGKPYCPCAIERSEDTVCKCKKFREDGVCECGLYYIEEDGSHANR